MSSHSGYDVAVIGAGISGIATAKCLLDDKFKIIVFEQTDHIGGLWHFTEHGYGVMRFTHMYVGKITLFILLTAVFYKDFYS